MKRLLGLVGLLVLGCNTPPGGTNGETGGIFGTDDGGPEGDTGGDDGADDSGDDDADDSGDGADGGPGPDPGQPICTVGEGQLDAPRSCSDSVGRPLAASFAPAVQWEFEAAGCDGYDDDKGGSLIVANLTDDNGDGGVDLCDVPDVAFTCKVSGEQSGIALFVLDGQTGEQLLHLEHLDEHVGDGEAQITQFRGPSLAAADLDDDGGSELVWSYVRDAGVDISWTHQPVVEALRGDGSALWELSLDDEAATAGRGISIADLDGGGHPTLLVAHRAISPEGSVLWSAPASSGWWWGTAPVTVDLDGDGTTEIIWDSVVLDASGGVLFDLIDPSGNDEHRSDVAVADIDEDGAVEILVERRGYYLDGGNDAAHSLMVYSASGVLEGSVQIVEPGQVWDWGWYQDGNGLAVSDVDGDGDVEALVPRGPASVSIVDFDPESNAFEGHVVEHPAASKLDPFGYYGQGKATSFDFLGQGTPQIVRTSVYGISIYAGDGAHLYDYGESDAPDWGWGREGAAVVADIDNDGSAEIVAWMGRHDASPTDVATIVALEDPNDGWAAARRIWNQSAYSPTGIREDGRVPTGEAPAWQTHNTFRVQATLSESDCRPPEPMPEG